MGDVTPILADIEQGDPYAGELVKLRYFAGMTVEGAADILEIPIGPPTGTGLMPGRGCSVITQPTRSAAAFESASPRDVRPAIPIGIGRLPFRSAQGVFVFPDTDPDISGSWQAWASPA